MEHSCFEYETEVYVSASQIHVLSIVYSFLLFLCTHLLWPVSIPCKSRLLIFIFIYTLFFPVLR